MVRPGPYGRVARPPGGSTEIVRRLINHHVPTIVAAVVVVALRWWTSHRRQVFHIRPDEPGQLAIARFMGRGARWNMFDHSTWRPAYGTLISPATWITSDPVTMYRIALGANAVLGGVSCALLAVLATRFTGRSRTTSAVLAAIAVLAPMVLFTTNWVWSEALVQTTFLVFVLAALRFHDTARIRWAVLMVLAAATGFATHSRLLPLSAVAAVLIVVTAWSGRLRWARAAALGVLLAASLVAVSAWSRVVVDRVWDEPAATNTASGVLGRLGAVGALGASMLGQVWYQLVVTAGLAGLGAFALVRAAAGRSSDRPLIADARIVLGAVVPLVGLSIVFMTDRWRPDQIVYGRYNDAVMGPVVLAGLAAVLTATRRRLLIDGSAVVALTVLVGAGLHLTSDDDLGAESLLRPMVLGLVAYARGPLDVVTVTRVAVVLMLVGLAAIVVTRAGRWRQGVALAVAIGLLVVGYRRTQPMLDATINTWASAGAVTEVRNGLLPAGVAVRGRLTEDVRTSVGAQRLRLTLYEFYLPENTVYLDGRSPGIPATPYVFAPVDDESLAAGGASLVWRDPAGGMGLWIEPDGF